MRSRPVSAQHFHGLPWPCNIVTSGSRQGAEPLPNQNQVFEPNQPNQDRSEEHTSELHALSLHDALPICIFMGCHGHVTLLPPVPGRELNHYQIKTKFLNQTNQTKTDRKSTRLNSTLFPYTTLFRSAFSWVAMAM